jgi:hypothetical protein
MNKMALVRKCTQTYGELRTDPSRYTPIPDLNPERRLPDWVRSLIEEAFDEGLKEGKAKERRRLRIRMLKMTFGMAGSHKGTIMSVFEEPK